MAEKVNIDSTDGWFIGEDQVFNFHILTPPSAVTGIRTPVDIAGWTFEWKVRINRGDSDPAPLTKASGSGIAIVGTYNADRDLNTQRVQVTVSSADTDPLAPRKYWHSLKRTNAGSETILADGTADLQQATTR